MEVVPCPPSVVDFLRHCRVAADACLRLDTMARLGADLAEANARANLTRITDGHEFWVKHVADSLSIGLLDERFVTGGARIADVGSGAGFPALPLAWACPSLRLTAIETNAKKVAFLTAEVERLALPNCRIVSRQAREAARLPEHAGAYDAVVARAVADPPSLVRECRQFLRPTTGAMLVIYSTPAGVALHWPLVAREAQKYSLTPSQSAVIDLPDAGGQRQFFLLRRP